MPIRILTVDDHPLLREGIAAVIEGQPDMQLVGEAASGLEALQVFRDCRPDVTLMDLQMPGMGGVEAIGALHREFPQAKVVVLTTYQGDAQALRAFKAGRRVTCSRACCGANRWTPSAVCTPAAAACGPRSRPASPNMPPTTH